MKKGLEEMNTDMPMELQLDLLVDDELSEADRRHLLSQLDREPPGPWRDLAIRFLQRQVEKETVRKLMAGGTLVPVELTAPAPAPSPIAGRIGGRLIWTLGIAAGLLLVATSAMVTFYLTQPKTASAVVAEFSANLPPESVSFDRSVPVTVPVVNIPGSAALFPIDDGDTRFSKSSNVYQPAGPGKVMMIQVRTLKAAVY